MLGGTFNPPHLAHLVCAQEAYLQLGLERAEAFGGASRPVEQNLDAAVAMFGGVSVFWSQDIHNSDR